MSKKPKFIVILLGSHTNSFMSNGLSFLDDVYTFSYDSIYFLSYFVGLFVFSVSMCVCMNKDESAISGSEEWCTLKHTLSICSR